MLGAMRRWVYRLASKAEGLILDEKADTAIVNLTAVNVAGGQVWL